MLRESLGAERGLEGLARARLHLQRLGAEGLATNPRALRTLATIHDQATHVEVQHLTHGLYVTGLSGEKPNSDSEKLQATLAVKRDEFCASHPELRMEFVLVPFARSA